MTRILFSRCRPGHRLVRGEPVRRLQRALEESGCDVGKIDGIYGGDTTAAVKTWQQRRGEAETGMVTFECWSAIVGAPPPSVRDRALQLTADFEGHGFGKVAGNFDDAWLTWGIIGFTLRHGEVQRIIAEVEQHHPHLLVSACGPLTERLLEACGGGAAAQEAFANEISLGRDRYKVRPEWAAAFDRLGSFAEVQEIQQRRVDRYWARGLRDARRFGLTSELGLALCFDIAVQNGGVDFGQEEIRIRDRLGRLMPQEEREVRLVIADVVAETSRPQYVEDVRSRKRTIATGTGTVHGTRYELAHWGLADVPAV